MVSKRQLSILLPVLISCLVFSAFYWSGNDGNDKDYQTAKTEFYKSYLQYKDNLSKGINTQIPQDPKGFFKVDNNGNFAINNGQTANNLIAPNPTPDLVSTLYTFSQSTGTYTSIQGTGTLVPGSTNSDDGVFGAIPIGFSFSFDGAAYTQVGCCANGFMTMGPGVPIGGYAAISGSDNNVIAPFSYDLQLAAAGGIYYATTGSAPNRIFTMGWEQCGFWPTTGNELSYQIKLFETTNIVQIIYQTGTRVTTSSLQVGLRGGVNTDFNNRTSTTSWASTTAGGTNTATVSFSPTIFPASGQIFQWAPPQPPATPTLVRPVYGAIGRYQNDTIQWTPSAGATNYNLQLAQDSLCTILLYSDTTLTGTAYVFGTFAPLQTYWWRVRAKNAAGWSSFTPTWKFKIMGPATTPGLIYPANNATNIPISVTCIWGRATDQTIRPLPLHVISEFNETQKGTQNDHPDAVSLYWFEIYSDTTTTAVLKDSTLTDTTRAVTGLLNNQNYWWRAKAKNNVGWGSFSPYAKFTTVVAAPPAPSNIYPANNALGIIPTTKVDWSTVAGATNYKLQISTDSTFATTQLDSVTTVDSLFVPAGRLTNNVKYYWHVRSQNVGGNSTYGPTWNFTTSLVGVISTGEIPKVFKLYSAYPNPFNPATTIKFDIPNASNVKLEVFNLLGQSVGVLLNSRFEAGSYKLNWDASNNPSGVYFYRINAGTYSEIKKMVLIK